ncbi:MAG TPA: cytochrome c biogenesis protein ResB [Pyrinomonadaceae bacterium]|nr:cytochrome c biogenesis protein ResB [Pyrinomonadaceae bacterium]
MPAAQAAPARPSPVTRALNLLSSVRFGVSLLILLVVACMIGMLIMQQNVDGFDKYYAELTPAQKLLYGKLGFFDIYHAWYFNALLLVLSLNIVLASIDRFPSAWTYISRKKFDATARWLRGQEQAAEVAFNEADRDGAVERVRAAMRAVRLKTVVTEKAGRTFIFGERGAWNRLGAYAVHVALLTIFFGGFLTAQFGRNGNMPLEPGKSADEMSERIVEREQFSLATYQLPFTVECTDIQQKLIRKEGPITADNTLDWLTRIRIKDAERGSETEALVHMNKPFDYRGYRFFQASFIADGKARQATVRVTPAAGGPAWDVTLPRDGAATLPDGTRVELKDFAANFRLGAGSETQEGSVYQNPAATLAVTRPGGAPARAFAFTPEMAERAPFARQPVEGYTFLLVDFEKVPRAHILSVQKDPGATVVYVGFGLLALTLSAVFFFSHERVWALVDGGEGGEFRVTLGGNTNRNKLGFGDRFRRVVEALGGEPFEVKKS